MPTKQHTKDDDQSQQKLNVRTPEVCVDYLSYRFEEMDLAASWQLITKQKNDIVDGIRLENASWRTWAKQRSNLKTVHPQTLNWLKESDVTWLYGPLHTVIKQLEEVDGGVKPRVPEDALGLMTPPSLKPALKKVSVADTWKRSNLSLSIKEVNKHLKAFSPAVLATHRQPKLRFNHQVEQCVALLMEEDDENIPRIFIKKIAPARLKRSQSDPDDDSASLSSDQTLPPGQTISTLAKKASINKKDPLSLAISPIGSFAFTLVFSLSK
ncbi:hypothetical protein DFQ28_004976 [Apophysomyces sp. BC1034]|nr:hypothetical protein DFQ30_002976 [Apophysomyces sp. BC1015]KAG0180135.1 hypothetical protein DFQ29_001197 [Apophysomyces sp. BC1021]KAG0188350.1 hypothetical protein DFQ28_004976 [Apophysomyces sp. BC1034]